MAESDGGGVGDPISQPGLIETNCSTTGTQTVANLSQFFNLESGPAPKIDAALAQVASGRVDSAGNILLLGATQTNGVPDPGAPAQGSGSQHRKQWLRRTMDWWPRAGARRD